MYETHGFAMSTVMGHPINICWVELMFSVAIPQAQSHDLVTNVSQASLRDNLHRLFRALNRTPELRVQSQTLIAKFLV
jgi:hypothetical protein